MVILIMLVMVNVAINDADADFDNGRNYKFAIMHNNNRCFQVFFYKLNSFKWKSWRYCCCVMIFSGVNHTMLLFFLPSHMTSRLKQQISIGWYNKLSNGNGISNRDCMCGRPHGQRFWTLTPSGGGDMEIQKACLKFTMLWRLVYAYVTTRLFIVV